MPGVDHYDDAGSLAHTASTDATNAPTQLGFGPAWRRFITAGIYNSDFAGQPPKPNDVIDNGNNPLPYWSFVSISGSAITAQVVADAASASGSVLRFTMTAGAAGDEAVIEQFVPINGTRSQTFTYVASLAFLMQVLPAGAATVNTRWQYFKNDGVTVTGAELVIPDGNLNLAALAPVVSNVFYQGIAPPADAYFLRVRVGVSRSAAAAGDTLVLDLAEVVLGVLPPIIGIADLSVPGDFLTIIAAGGTAAMTYQGGAHSPRILLDTGTGDISLSPQVGNVKVGGNGGFAFTPPAAQVVFAGTTINVLGGFIPISAVAPVTLTSVPTVANGIDGQLVVLVNTSANAVTVQDQGTLAGSNLRLSTATFVLGQRDNLTLLYSTTVGDWIEIARTNVI